MRGVVCVMTMATLSPFLIEGRTVTVLCVGVSKSRATGIPGLPTMLYDLWTFGPIELMSKFYVMFAIDNEDKH